MKNSHSELQHMILELPQLHAQSLKLKTWNLEMFQVPPQGLIQDLEFGKVLLAISKTPLDHHNGRNTMLEDLPRTKV